jgi:molybdate transport system substrate-binding protein
MRLLAFLLAALAAFAGAAEIKVLSGSALDAPLRPLIAQFESATGHRILLDADGAIGAMAERVARAEYADVLIVSPAQLAALERQGKIARGSVRELARTGVGVFVRKGAAKPDIGSVDAFKRAMLRARSIGYNDPAAGAPVSVYLIELFKRLGIAQDMQPKTAVFKRRGERFAAVARGDVEIGFNQVAQIVTVAEIELAGPLPPAIQCYTVFGAGLVSSSRHPAAATSFIDFVSAPAAKALLRRKGFE